MPTIADLEKEKLRSFDPLLADIVATRIIYHQRVKTRESYLPLITALTPVVKKHVNPRIIDAIANGHLELDYRATASRRAPLYVPEDRASLALRNLVTFYHGNDNRIMVRRMVKSCIQIVADTLNSDLVATEVLSVTKNARAA